MPRKKRPEDSTPTASEILDAWQSMVHEQLLNPERIADWLGAANNMGKATTNDKPAKHATSSVSEHDAIAELKQHVAKLERRIRKLESAVAANAKPSATAKPRARVAKSATKTSAKPKRPAKRTTKK